MVVGGADAVGLEQLGYLTGFVTVAHVDDGRARYALQDVQYLVVLVLGVAHHVVEVLALEAHAEDILLLKQQALLDVLHHLGGGGSGEGKDGGVGKLLAYVGNGQVRGAEVVAPL